MIKIKLNGGTIVGKKHSHILSLGIHTGISSLKKIWQYAPIFKYILAFDIESPLSGIHPMGILARLCNGKHPCVITNLMELICLPISE